MIRDGLIEKECARCGKIFYIHPGYVYRREVSVRGHQNIKYFCKYSCMRAHDREVETQKAERRAKRKTPDAGTSSV